MSEDERLGSTSSRSWHHDLRDLNDRACFDDQHHPRESERGLSMRIVSITSWARGTADGGAQCTEAFGGMMRTRLTKDLSLRLARSSSFHLDEAQERAGSNGIGLTRLQGKR